MIKLLETVLEQVARLPEREQDRIAQLVLDEIAAEARWQAVFVRSQDKRADPADPARKDIERGEVQDEKPSTRSE